jgi:hypothetical protein
MNKLEIVNEVAKGYNNLDSSIIEAVASDNIIYESQWVISSINTKVETFKYLKHKFEILKKSETKLFAEIAYYDEDPCIILAQDTTENKVATLLIEVTNEQVSRMDICEVPNWRDCKRTNEYPH